MFGVTYWSISIFYPSFHFVFTILSRSYLWFTIIFISPIITICWPCHVKSCGIYMVLSILLVFSRQIGVCGIWSYRILCYSIFSYQFFSYGNWTCLNLLLSVFPFFISGSLPIFFGLILLLCLGLTYSYALSWSYLFLCFVLVLLILMLCLGLTYSYCYLGVQEERYCVSYHKVRICSFIRHWERSLYLH